MQGTRLTHIEVDYIYSNYQSLSALQIAKHLNVTKACVWERLRRKGLKAKRKYTKQPLLSRDVIALVLNDFANNGYQMALTSRTLGISYHKVRWYVTHYYTRKRLNEETELITLPSAV